MFWLDKIIKLIVVAIVHKKIYLQIRCLAKQLEFNHNSLLFFFKTAENAKKKFIHRLLLFYTVVAGRSKFMTRGYF